MTDQASSAKKINPPVKYLLYGVLFGLLFPVVSIIWMLIISRATLNLAGIGQIHSQQHLIWVIDSRGAPVTGYAP
jgi:hypothetical protein